MTGERDPIVKVSLSECKEDEPKKAHCFLFSGSIVSSGSGIMMVAAVGKRTCFSHIMTKNIDIPEPTPLQYKLQDLGEKLGKYGLYAGLVIFFGQFVHLFIDCYYRDVTYGITGFAYHTIHFILVSITVGIFGIPEGLPVIVSLGLAHRLENMANDNSLVVKLEGSY